MDKFFQCVFILLLWAFGMYGTVWVYKQRKKLNRLQRVGLRTTGVVTGHRFTEGDGTYMAELIFLTREGTQQKTETTTTHTPQEFPKGTRIPILYNPVNPTDCFVDTYVEQQSPAVILGFIWLVVIGITILWFRGVPLEGSAT